MAISSEVKDMLSAVKSALGASVTPNLTTASAAYDIFEAYLFGLVLTVARELGGNVTYRNISGTSSSIVTFRTSPSWISTATQDYTYAILTFPGKPPVEVHLGIYVAGTPGAHHECDVVIVDQAEAEACRASRTSPRSKAVRLAIECKYYVSRPTIGLGRGFLGLREDLNLRKATLFVTNNNSESIKAMLKRRAEDSCCESAVPRDSVAIDTVKAKLRVILNRYLQ